MKTETTICGFPRIGEQRELKRALESYWTGKIGGDTLLRIGADIREKQWKEQQSLGLDLLACNDFSLYDNMLDTAWMLNAIPKRFLSIKDPLKRYFAMARGWEEIPPMEMTKWFDTNYHYIVPELERGMEFCLDTDKISKEYKQAKSLGLRVKINLIGPVTFTALSKGDEETDPFDFYSQILSCYKELILYCNGFDEELVLQLEEPVFVGDCDEELLYCAKESYDELSRLCNKTKIICTSYFEHSCELVEVLADTPIYGFGLDFVDGIQNLDSICHLNGKKLIAGVVSGRNIWRLDYQEALKILYMIEKYVDRNDIIISSSASLLHLPYSVKNETELSIQSELSFAMEKCKEIVELNTLFRLKNTAIDTTAPLKRKADEIQTSIFNGKRIPCYEEREKLQRKILDLPLLPTTTIGSFPQTKELRLVRRMWRKGEIGEDEYCEKIKEYIDTCIDIQRDIGLDVYVHGEPERGDMVEYFAEQLEGYAFTKNGWVQSYGSRCVKPPILYADISRLHELTVKWTEYAQRISEKPVKGMLTGPITMMKWSFIREDIPKAKIAQQLAQVIHDEICDLQKAGIRIIQVDEAAFKEAYPLRRSQRKQHEKWAVESFQLAVSSAHAETQVHSHMCYSDFHDIIHTIEAMDADVISLENARSSFDLVEHIVSSDYSNGIGPGVYDIHSTRIPEEKETEQQIRKMLSCIPEEKLWINPDCGLKTRRWEELIPALKHMCAAAKNVRESLDR